MGLSPQHYEAWREQARSASEDRFTVLWDELFAAHEANDDPFDRASNAFFLGLLRAYALVTGDTEEVVNRQLTKRAFDEMVAAPTS